MDDPIKDNKEISVSRQDYDALKKEYEQFVYMISHDLNAPFRHIKGFTEILVNKMDEQTAAANAVYTDAIHSSVAKCQSMLESLLQLSRIKKTDDAAPYDLNTCMVSVQKRLAEHIKNTNAVIECETLPTVNGYWQHINELFYQLITNAIKFQPKSQAAHVQISAEELSDAHVIHVTDNGIGISDKYYDDIFTIFRRLNHESEYVGIGAGLSICKKIMDLHDGTITIGTNADGKTRFTVSFPK